jgi:GT2 family glycosyltransferase
MNQGIRLAGGDYVLLLNQDAWIREDFVSNAVRIMEHACPDVGMAAARIFRLEGSRETDQLVGGGLVSRRRVQLVGDLDVTHEHYTMSPSFCCPFLRRAMLDDVMSCCGHYFDDRYFAHGEDLDLALRAQLRGWKCLFSPDLVAWHSHSASLGGKVRLWEKPPFYRKLSLRNRYMTIIKDVPLALIMCLAPAIVIAEFATWPYFLIKSPSTLRCLLEAYVETIRMLPGTYMLRRRIQASRRVSTKYLRQFFRGF